MADVVKGALSGQTDAPSFLITCMQLVEVSYMPADQIGGPDGLVAGLTPFADDCAWACPTDAVGQYGGSLLAFVATYGKVGAPPPVIAVVIRGTDTDVSSYASVLAQFGYDVLVEGVTDVPWTPVNGAKIADGTSDAFANLESVNFGPTTDFQVSLSSYVYDMVLSTYQDHGFYPSVYVVGHSLGGCLASVYAPAIAKALTDAEVPDPFVMPVTFAAPTAGNGAFVAAANALCPNGVRVVNNSDVVPLAWDQLEDWKTIYRVWGIEPDAFLRGFIDLVVPAIAACDYTQFAPNIVKYGIEYTDGTDTSFTFEAENQHAAINYMGLLGGENIPGYPADGNSALT